MTPERFQQIDKLLELALEREPSERGRFLDEACDGDQALRTKLESLLRSHEQARGYLAGPPSGLANQILAGRERELAADGVAGPAREQGTGSGGTLSPAGVERVLHYEVQTKLGEGGMGVVYKAVDHKLNRLVALKFLPPQIDRSNVDLQRFLQEANALSALNHPHIATIYAVETAGERQFLVLEYLPGGTLKAKLQQTSSSGAALSIDDVLKYAQQTAEGLAHAHARGIIHRDVKTSNLMLTEEGDVKVTDFGVAKLTRSSVRTIPGSLMGTIAYMSPEQALGVEVDARSDAFSFGVVLFELITGRLPFEAPNDAALLMKVANARVPELKAFRADVPPGLERIVGKALRKRLEERYGTMGGLLADIRALRDHHSSQTRLSMPNEIPAVAPPQRTKWVVGVVATIMVAVLAAALFSWSRRLLRAPAEQTSVAKTPPEKALAKQAANQLVVLPFRSVGQGQADETLSEQVMTKLTQELAELAHSQPSLSVVPTSEVRKEKVTTPREAVARLGATLVLSGAMIQDGDRLIVAANLFDAQKQSVVNAVDIDISITQLPTLHQSLTPKVEGMLKLQMAEAPGARELYLQGRGHLERYDRLENLENAISAFERALSKDDKYVLAHAGRAEAYLRKYRLRKDESSLDRARESVMTAIQSNGQLAPVAFAMGLYRVATGDQKGAIESFQQSLAIERGPDAIRELANLYDAMNRPAEAEETYPQAIQMRRGYWLGYKDLAVFYQRHGRVTKALPLFLLVVQLAPDNSSGYTNLGAVYSKLGKYSDAADAFKLAVEIDPSALAYYALGTSFFNGHRYPEAVDAYMKCVKLNPTDAAFLGALGDASHHVPGMADVTAEAYSRAIALREGELKIRPRDARLRADIASWSILTDKKRALKEIGAALRLNPRDGRVQATASVVYEQLHRRRQAIAAVEKALGLGYSLEEIRNWPALENLRQDPRYKRIVATFIEGGTVKTSND